MQTLEISKLDRRARFNLGLAIIQRIEKPLTLADVDLSESTDELDQLISKYAGGHCTSFEFYDDNHKHGSVRHLEYNIVTQVYTGQWENDEGTAVAETESHKERISVPVQPGMTLDRIARAIAMEIRGIDGNRFA